MNTTKTPRLYEYTVCPFCKKVEAILLYKKIPFESIEVHPLKKKEIEFSKNYKKVPIYIDEKGNQINDSTLIMRHIDQSYKDKPVFETNQDNVNLENKWLSWSDDVLVKALPPLIYNSYSNSLKAFNYITKIGKFSLIQRWIIKYSGALAMTIVAKKKMKQYKIENPVEHFKKCLSDWAEELQQKPYQNGSQPNGADFAIYGILMSIENLPCFVFVQQNETVYEWYKRMHTITHN